MTDWVNDKFRFIIQEARTNRIISYDLPVNAPKVMRKLSGPCMIEFDVDYRDPRVSDPETGEPILFKPWGHWCHIEYNYRGERKIFASGIFKPSEVDSKTGMLRAQFEGFSGYPKGMPWLQNWNPIAVDPFHIVNKIWTHLQAYNNGTGNLGVIPYSAPNDKGSWNASTNTPTLANGTGSASDMYTVSVAGTSLGATFAIGDSIFYDGSEWKKSAVAGKVVPALSNTQMLPGFSFDGQTFVLDFFAIFIRAVDFTDCGDYINKIARDVPFDYFEECEWNEDRTEVNKYLRLAYQDGGTLQSNLAFRLNENIFEAKSRIESEIEWTSDVIIRGWYPGKVYSKELTNADDFRYRRTVLEEDVNINSGERAEAWAGRQLTRRQIPSYWKSIIVNMYHPNAPFGSYDVGDTIRVQGVMPWVGNVDQLHRIIAMSIDLSTNTAELSLMAEGAFNYDPIFFDGVDPNLITNPSFTNNLTGWTSLSGTWSRDATFGGTNPGSVRVTANAQTKELTTSAGIPVSPRDRVSVSCSVYWQDAQSADNSSPIRIKATAYNSLGIQISEPIFNSILQPSGDSDSWMSLSGKWTVPSGIASIKVQLEVTNSMQVGEVWFDDVYVSKYPLPF